MMKILKRFFLAVGIVLLLAVSIPALSLVFPPAGAVVELAVEVVEGNIYYKAGNVTLQYEGEQIPVPVYKAKGRPFLLIGPHRFYEPDEDFLFVSPDLVVASATDKGGGSWNRIGSFLLVLDDMTSKDRLRIPYWDLLKDRSPDANVTSIKGAREYRVIVDDGRKLTFRIPESLFTPDMPSAAPYLELPRRKQAGKDPEAEWRKKFPAGVEAPEK